MQWRKAGAALLRGLGRLIRTAAQIEAERLAQRAAGKAAAKIERKFGGKPRG